MTREAQEIFAVEHPIRGRLLSKMMLTMVGTAARDYRSIPAGFLPYMREHGVSEGSIAKLMHANPWSALSR